MSVYVKKCTNELGKERMNVSVNYCLKDLVSEEGTGEWMGGVEGD